MADIYLGELVITPPLASAAALAAVDISSYADGVTCNVAGLGNFSYSISSVATGNNITVIQPSAGSGRWLIQKPTISTTYRLIGNTTGSAGPASEVPITALGYSIMNGSSASGIRSALSCPSNSGDTATGTWPINITGYCGSFIGAISTIGNVATLNAGVVNYSNIQNASAGKVLLGNAASSPGAYREITLGENLTLSSGGVLDSLGTAGALLRAQNLADLISVPTARTNLGLGTVAVKAASDASKTTVPMISSFTSGNYAKFDSVGSLVDGGATPTGALLAVNNLSDVASVSTSRTNLGLGTAAVKGVTDVTKTNAVMLSTFTSGNYAKFDVNGSLVDGGSDPAGALLPANNLSDVASVPTSRTNLGLGAAALVGVTDATKTDAVMLSSFVNGHYAKFDSVGSVVDGGLVLLPGNNLSDVSSITTARTNLGLGAAALKGVTDASKTNVAMISTFANGHYATFDTNGSLTDGGATPAGVLLAANNLSDVASAATSRTNLGLGAAAIVGVTDATKTNAVMLSTFTNGNYAKFDVNGSLVDGGSDPAGALIAANNLSDLVSVPTARTNLGLGAAALVGVTDATKSEAVMLSSFTNGHYAKFDSVGSVVDGGAFPNLTGDVTSSGTVTTIASHATTFAKMQQIPTVTLLGNPTGGTADIETLTLGSNLGFSGTTLNVTGALLTANNLSELTGTASTARTNLGLGAAAIVGVTDATKTDAVMLSTFTNGHYAQFDTNGSLVDGGAAPWQFTPNTITSSTQVPLVAKNAYYFSGDFNGSLLLPTSSAVGDAILIYNTLTVNIGSPKTITIAQNGLTQNISLGSVTTTGGSGGSLTNTVYGCSWMLLALDNTATTWLLTNVTNPSSYALGVFVQIFTVV